MGGIKGINDAPFELIALIGTGAFAHTYKARVTDEDLLQAYGSEIVAVKVPLNRKKEMGLRREVETNAALHMRMRNLHAPNIVRYLGFEVFDGKIVMVVEFVGGGSLRDRVGKIGRQKRLPVEEAVKITTGILGGLSVIHQQHIFHRAIKPENILMDGDTPKISDLGVARMLETNELASTGTGTLFYMSPESLSREGASFSSDIWAVGATLYELVAGRLPFGAMETPIGTLIAMITESDPLPAHQACKEVPEALSRIITRALERDPEKRYPRAEDMAHDLQSFLAGKAVMSEEGGAPPMSPTPRAMPVAEKDRDHAVHSVFISYSTKDKQTAKPVYDALKAGGVRCWMAPYDVTPGLDYDQEILDAIDSCGVVVLVLSSNSNTSPDVKREVSRAVKNHVPVIPLRIEDVELGRNLEYFLGEAHWLDAFPPPITGHLEELTAHVRKLLARKARPA